MRVACYVRVSTEDQSLNRQLESTHEYARDLGADRADIETYRDKSTGTDTERGGYREMMAAVENGEHDAVVVHSVSRVSRSIRDLSRTVDRVVEESDTDLHVISEGFEIRSDETDPYQKAMFQLLGVFAELEADLAQQRTKEGIAARQNNPEYHHGRAPLGFGKDGGELYEADNYDRVVTVLELVAKDNMSKRKAAKKLDTSRRTINRAMDRLELYDLGWLE